MEPGFEYSFPAIRGIQASREYYVSQCPLRLVPKLFLFDEPDLPPAVRAQRTLNRARVPEIASYIVDNRDSYVFSALTASIDSHVRFEPVSSDRDATRIGLLKVPMEARFIVNDGQHRRAAIDRALAEDPTLGDETIAIVFFLDIGLDRCQQMFADLNRYAVKPSPSLGVLYDHRDPYAAIARKVVEIPLLGDVVEMEQSSLAKLSRKLITLSAIHTAVKALLGGVPADRACEQTATAVQFFEGISQAFPEWRLVHERKMRAAEVREDFIHTYSVTLHAIANAGAALIAAGEPDWVATAARLAEIDWSKRNGMWEGRAMGGGHMAKSRHNIVLTTSAIKQHLGIELSPDERKAENAYTGNNIAA